MYVSICCMSLGQIPETLNGWGFLKKFSPAKWFFYWGECLYQPPHLKVSEIGCLNQVSLFF